MANAFADALAQEFGGFEPQRQHTWLISFHSLPGAKVLELALRTGFLPSENNEEIEIPYMNSRVYIAGKYAVDAGSLTFNDYVDSNVAGILANWRKLVYDVRTGQLGYARSYKKTATITLYGPELIVERTWSIKGIWPQAVNYGAIDYSSSDVVQVECTFRYDKAIPDFADTAVGI